MKRVILVTLFAALFEYSTGFFQNDRTPLKTTFVDYIWLMSLFFGTYFLFFFIQYLFVKLAKKVRFAPVRIFIMSIIPVLSALYVWRNIQNGIGYADGVYTQPSSPLSLRLKEALLHWGLDPIGMVILTPLPDWIIAKARLLRSKKERKDRPT